VQVSFVIPLFNCLELTRTCVQTLQRTIPEGLTHEIILIDDGSTDGTREWLATLGEPFRVLLNERNLGYAGANNRGVAAARGTELVLLNNDLEFAPGWLEPMRSLWQTLGAEAGVVGNIQLNARTGAVDHAGMMINAKAKPAHRTDLDSLETWWRGHRVVPAVTAACIAIGRDLWTKLGGFDEGFVNGGEDVDLCFRAAALGRVNAVALRSVIRHHVSASPGRKLRDEHNSYRLARRWRSELAAHAAEEWCRSYLIREWVRTTGDHRFSHAWTGLLYAGGIRRTVPDFVKAGVDAALDQEFARWRELFPQATETT
jgi:GT2 family glycosyltransferase